MEPLSLRLLNKVPFRCKTTGHSFVLLLITMIPTIITITAVHFNIVPKASIAIVVFTAYLLLYTKDRYFTNDFKLICPQLVNGTITFHDGFFHIREKQGSYTTTSLNSVQGINIVHANYNGYTMHFRNMRLICSGACAISIKLKDEAGSKFKFDILINSQEEFNRMVEHLKHWYQIGIQIKEYPPGTLDRSVLFRTNWTYEQYQELKKELGVERFY